MDEEFAGDVVRLLWMADRNLYEAFDLIHTSPYAGELEELQSQITGIMTSIHRGIIQPLYDQFPNLKPTRG
jgi:hypothetical protein